jgi:hypothetical protein
MTSTARAERLNELWLPSTVLDRTGSRRPNPPLSHQPSLVIQAPGDGRSGRVGDRSLNARPELRGGGAGAQDEGEKENTSAKRAETDSHVTLPGLTGSMQKRDRRRFNPYAVRGCVC